MDRFEFRLMVRLNITNNIDELNNIFQILETDIDEFQLEKYYYELDNMKIKSFL